MVIKGIDDKASAAPAMLPADDETFGEIVGLIEQARAQALASVNTALIGLYWTVGGIISRKLAAAEWGEGVVEQLAAHIAQSQPGLRGFTRSSLFRMRQFFELYPGDENVAPLVRQISWSHHLVIMGQAKRQEEREFYLRMAAQER
jgi:hypothetical protein